VRRARLYRKTGDVLDHQNLHNEALDALGAAETALGQEPAETIPEWWQEWLEIQFIRVGVYYHTGQLDELSRQVEKIRPLVDQYGTPAQRYEFFDYLTMMNLRHDRFVVSDETLACAQLKLTVSQEEGNPRFKAWSRFTLGFLFLWRGEFDRAEEFLQDALRWAKKVGDVRLQAICLTYLAITCRKQRQVEEVRILISRILPVAMDLQDANYLGTARANQAWLAWHEGNLSEAQVRGKAALEIWQRLQSNYPFQWTAIWPLIGVALRQAQDAELAQERVSVAIDHVQVLLEPSQQQLPHELTSVLENAINTWGSGELEMTCTYLNHAIELAQELGYL
jgi:tetratricopeptide (TPR) repeat protein